LTERMRRVIKPQLPWDTDSALTCQLCLGGEAKEYLMGLAGAPLSPEIFDIPIAAFGPNSR
jgi:hypothetical protein